MIALDERKAQYKPRKINDVIEFEGELYVVVAIGKTDVLNNGCFQTKLLCQSLVEDDSCFELNTTISKPKIVKNMSYENIRPGDFVRVGGTTNKYARLVGLASLEWAFTDLMVSWVAEPVQPISKRECTRLAREYKRAKLHGSYELLANQKVIKLNFEKA